MPPGPKWDIFSDFFLLNFITYSRMFSTLSSVYWLNCFLSLWASLTNRMPENSKLFTLVTVSPNQTILLCLFHFSKFNSTFCWQFLIFTRSTETLHCVYCLSKRAVFIHRTLLNNFISNSSIIFLYSHRECIFHTFHLFREHTNRDIVTFPIAQTDHVTDFMVQHINRTLKICKIQILSCEG